MAFRRGAVLILVVLGWIAAPLGCDGGDASTDDGGGEFEEGTGDGEELGDVDDEEWGWECELDEDCRDDIDCTVDVCDRGLCRNTPDNAPCQDGQVCNGEEVCYARDGCGPGEPFRGCNDADPCTMDRCVEPEPGFAPGCDHLPLDRDGDTHVDMRCFDGDDCEDVDPLSYPGAMERCFDTFDNNCDGFVDAADPVCQMDFDTCDSPRELVPGAEWEGFTHGATAGVNASCDISSYADVVFSFTVTETSDALLSVDAGSEYAYVALQRTCGDTASELRCSSSSQVSIFERALEPGTYYVTVSGWDNPAVTGDEFTFRIRVDLYPAGPAAPGDTCDDPIALTLPAHEEGSLTRMDDDVSLRCASWMDGADTVYTFELTEPQDVTIDVAAARISPYVSLQTDCTAGGDVLVCDSGYPFHRTIGNVPAGTYYLWVEATGAGTYSLDVSTADPVDRCADLEVIDAGGAFSGTTVGMSDASRAIGCGSSGGQDVTYELQVAATSSLVAEIGPMAAGDWDTVLHLRSVCDDPATQIVCDDDGGTGVLSYLEVPSLDPGTYYLTVDGYSGSSSGAYTLNVTLTPL